MNKADDTPVSTLKRLRGQLLLAHAGLVAERATKAFWPLISITLVTLAALMFGLHEVVPVRAVLLGATAAGLVALAALVNGLRRFRWPSEEEALERLDRMLPGRPIAAILDHQAVGADDPASRAVWRAHLERMAAAARSARAPKPNLSVADRDPYALRYVAILAFSMAVLFGSAYRLTSVPEVLAGGSTALAGGGPSWEGWVQPPGYTGKPTIYLADVDGEQLPVPQGSRVLLRLYGEVGALTVAETVSGSGRSADQDQQNEFEQAFEVTQSGTISINGPGGRDWEIIAIADSIPEVGLAGEAERSANGDMRVPFFARDDHGVVSGWAEIALDLASVERRLGLAIEPEPRETIELDLPMPFSGDRSEFTEILVDDLSQHPWAGLPVRITLFAADAAGQIGTSGPERIVLPGRRFFDPLAAAIVEQRRDLLWSRENGRRVARVLRAVSHRPEDIFDSDTAYLKLRVAIRRLESGMAQQELSRDRQEEIAAALWSIAIDIEEGNLADARERLREARERLSQAMRDGANDEEIAKLMEELRDAMRDYMDQLAQEQQGQQNELAQDQEMQIITQEELQQMMDRIQELMEQGRMSEAQDLLDQLSEMMENLQMAEGQGNEGPGQQALEGLADTLREQQGLSDDTFGDLQEQFGQDGQQGEQGQNGQQQGQQGGQGSPSGQQGERGQNGPDGRGQQPGQGGGRGAGSDPAQGLADRQRALRQQLDQQLRNLPGAGTPGGDDARDALGRAGRAMDGAEQALRDNDFAGALDEQAEALEALREGMRELAEQLAQQQSQQAGQQGQANGRTSREGLRDPLGRDAGAAGRIGTDERLLQGEDVYRRAQELLDEIRRRSSDRDRPELERRYLRRLLDRF